MVLKDVVSETVSRDVEGFIWLEGGGTTPTSHLHAIYAYIQS